MSLTKLPMPMLAAPKTQGRKMQSILSPSLYGEEKAKKGLFTELPELREKSVVLEPISSPSIALQSDFIPEEILSALTSAANAVSHPSSFTAAKKSQISPHIQKGIRNTNPLWHHPIRRSKFKHLTEQPICLTGAGRDISFLCDVYTMGKKADTPGASASASSLSRTQSKNLQQPAEELDLEESLIPEEFHIIKSKGVLGLEYYEDKYTTLLEDSEKRLRSFPSMKPNGRSEVIQLMKVMESMLKKARVDEENLDTTGPTQMHSLLELLKKEQNIYNIVFHELIRQVSVDCVERGELLAKLRHRYVNLLDRIPRQVRSLHNSMMAQRALDRCLTDELIQFKNAIELLARELYEVREHDLNVSKEAKDIQKQLVSAVQETEQKANLLEEYRELYELQRRRLETHLGYLTEERDMWSSATYKLARKVIEKKKLHHAHNLYLSEKSWTQIIRYFIVCLASQDTSDLAEIQQVTEAWREMMMHFGEELGRAEESSREKIRFLQSRLTNWHKYFQEKVFENESFKNVPYQVVEQILEDFRSGENIIIKELERFAGDMLLTNQETLKTTAEMQKNWTDLGQRMLQAYWNLNEPPSVLDTMNDVNTSVTKLTQQYARRMDGENGVASALMSIVSSLETWAVSLQKLRDGQSKMVESDWWNFFEMLPKWMAQVERVLTLIGTALFETELKNEKNQKELDLRDVFKMLQQWILAMTKHTEKNDAHLTQELNNLHKAMVQWMVDLLMFLTSDYSSEGSELSSTKDEEASQTVMKNLMEDAKQLTGKLSQLTFYIVSYCKKLEENISLKMTTVDPEFEVNKLETVKNECETWIETCQLILSDITGSPVSLTSPMRISLDSIQPETPSLPSKLQEEKEKHGAMPDGSQTEFPWADHLKETDKLSYDFMKIIGHDAVIYKKSLQVDKEALVPGSTLTVSKPETVKAQDAFQSLATLEVLEEQLLQTEIRAQKAEEITESLNDRLRAAQEKILELEQQLGKRAIAQTKAAAEEKLPAEAVSEVAAPVVSKPTKKVKFTRFKLP